MGEQIVKKHYECFVTKSEYDRDDYNYSRCKDSSWIETADTVEALYEKLAQLKTRETPEEEQKEEYTTVSFGLLREVAILSADDVDPLLLSQTVAWQEHEKSLQAKRDLQTQDEQERAARAEANERAELARLQAKYPS